MSLKAGRVFIRRKRTKGFRRRERCREAYALALESHLRVWFRKQGWNWTDDALADERRPLRPTEQVVSTHREQGITLGPPIKLQEWQGRGGSTSCVLGTTFLLPSFYRQGSAILNPCFPAFFLSWHIQKILVRLLRVGSRWPRGSAAQALANCLGWGAGILAHPEPPMATGSRGSSLERWAAGKLKT